MTSKTIRRRRLRATTAFAALGVAGALSIAAPAQAQVTSDTVDTPDVPVPGNTIVVTGSRIARPDLEASVPIAVLGEQQLEQQGFENFADIATQNPQFAPSFGTSRTQSTFSGAADSGLNNVNLRQLGPERTLVLINGRRVPGGSPISAAVDFNLITTANLDRVEVITGGGSAVYGSDAVAGVVNLITKKDFRGLEVGASYGIAEAGDNENPNIYAMFGSELGDGGFLTLTAQYDFQGLVSCANRYLCAEDFAWTNPATGPIRGPSARSGVPLGGRFFVGDTSYTRAPDGSYVPFSVPLYGYNRNAQRTLAIPTNRYLAAAEAEYPITDSVNAFLEFSYGRSTTRAPFEAAPFTADTNVFGGGPDVAGLPPTIPVDNPFIPAFIRAQATPEQAEEGLFWWQRFEQLGARGATNERQTTRFAGGLNGDFEAFGDRQWSWEVSYVYGRHRYDGQTEGLVGTDRLYYGLRVEADAANPGSYRCSDAGARAAGCIPINPFLPYTQEQVDYLVVSAGQSGVSTLHDAQAFVTGELFELPGGPLSFAAGAEYRTFSGYLDYDDPINRGLTTGNQLGDYDLAETKTKEVFGEVIVPVLANLPFVESLTLEGAYRFSDPNRGDSYETWKYGGTYEPIPGLRFRAIRARSVRAPEPGDLSGISQTFGVVNDPCTAARRNDNPTRAANCAADGVPANYAPPLTVEQSVQGFELGNPELEPEQATTLTYGVAFTPRFLPGFSLTIDRFEIDLSDVISTVGRQEQANRCYDTADRQFCGALTRGTDPAVPGATYVLKSVNDQLFNVAGYEINGFDIEARYVIDISETLGQLALRAAATHYDRAEKSALPDTDPFDYLGTAGGSTADQGWLRWQANFNAFYSLGGFSANYNLRFIPKTDAAESTRGTDFPKIDEAFYHDIRLGYVLDEGLGNALRYEIYFGVNNLLDKDPPFFPTGTSGTQALDTIPAYYDVFGRSYYVGLKANF